MDTNEFTKPDLDDVYSPQLITGLPEGIKVLRISCGSHHTSILLEDGSVWAQGIACDKPVLIDEVKPIFQPGTISLPVRQFESFFDKTVIVTNDGEQVIELKLLSSPDSNNEWSSFSTPDWLEDLDPHEKVRSVQYGWKHTVILTDE